MFEQLEPRRFLSVTLNQFDQVQIIGSDAADEVFVRVRGDELVVTENGQETTFALRDVTLIDASGGGGNDRIVVDRSVLITSQLAGGDGNDLVVGGGGISWIQGDAGNDQLYGGGGRDSLAGGDGDDHLWGGAGGDGLAGGAGNDQLHGGGGHDDATGGDGDDLLAGGAGGDALGGDGDRDTLGGGAGNDHLDGGDGDDHMSGGAGDDALTDALGTNAFIGNAGVDRATLVPGSHRIAGLELKVRVDAASVLDDYWHDLTLQRDAAGNVTANVLIRMSDGSYSAAFGALVRDGNGFSVNVGVESSGGPVHQAIVTVEEDYSLGVLPPGRYTFSLRTTHGVDAEYTFVIPGRGVA